MGKMNKAVIVVFMTAVFAVLHSGIIVGQDKPNIILFLVDDADKYQFGCYGGPVYTPNIDKLASEGILFHNAHVNSTVCTPSRYSLTTGRYAGRSVYGEYLEDYPKGNQGHPEFNVGLEQNFMNIGYRLQSAGYKTGWVGKYHLHDDETLLNGLTSSEKSYLKTAKPGDPQATALFQQEEQAFRNYIVNKGFSWAKNIYEGNLEDPFKAHNLEWTIEAALEFIDAAGDSPFYLHFNTTLLHGPNGEWEESMKFPEMTGEGIVNRELNANMPARNTVIERIQANGYNLDDNPAGITWLDDGVGAVLKKLDDLGIAENTIFVFLPDHGSANKASLFYKHGTNIPLIIRYPGKITPGSQSSSLVQGIDLIPTFYEYAGVDLPREYQIDGKSLRPLFNNPEEKIHESLYFELGCARAVMTDRYKYIATRYPQDRIQQILKISEDNLKEKVIRKLIYLNGHVGISSRGIVYNSEYLSPDQLYDISVNTDEKDNLAAHPEYQNELNDMKEILHSYLVSFPDRPFGEFISGTNASAPHPQVIKYIQNIQNALRNGASIKNGILTCDGNCVLTGLESLSESSPEIVKLSQSKQKVEIQFLKPVSQLKLYDVFGREILNLTKNSRDLLVLNKNNYTSGVYLLVCRDGKNWKVYKKKFVIE